MQEQKTTKEEDSIAMSQPDTDDEFASQSVGTAQPEDNTSPEETDIARIAGEQPETSAARPQTEEQAFDWFALGVVIIAAAVFALAGRLNAQPPTSLTPTAVLSAIGCGMLVTGLRKTRTTRRPGLLEAGLGGFALALCQFAAALSYPGIIQALAATPDERTGFLTTWVLVALLAVIFSMAGAALGHLAFAPLRPTPAKKTAAPDAEPVETARETEQSDTTPESEQPETIHAEQSQAEGDVGTQFIAPSDQPPAASVDAQFIAPTSPSEHTAKRARSWYSYAVSVCLLGLAPTLVGYVFAAAFDYMLGVYHFLLGPYPTLRLLGTFLPWQVPIPFDPGSGSTADLLRLVELWRIPIFLGNPTMFDILSLEPYVFTGAGLAILLLTLRDEAGRRIVFAWPIYLLLEALLGLLLVMPADLWIMRGLQGLLRAQIFVLPIRTLYILNTLTFVLNIVTGPVVCVFVGAGIWLLLRVRDKSASQTVESPH